MKIPFCKPYVGNEEIKAVKKAIKSGWLTTGKVTEELEQKIADYTGAKYCVMLNSCTAALHLSLEYLKQDKYENSFKALVPSLTFAATAEAVLHAGGEVIWGDVNEDMCLKQFSLHDFDIAIPVHLCGTEAKTNYTCDVVEDCAHLIYKDQCKNSKHFFCYSFYATKNLTMGEGGCICTNDEKAYNWFKQARHHGISRDGWKRYEGSNWKYDIEFLGWKYNPSDVLSSILLANFDKIFDIHIERQRCVGKYNELLGYKNKGVHLYPIMVKDRDSFIELMAKKGIQCSVHFLPLHKMTAFRHIPVLNNLKKTEKLGEKLVSLPLYPELTDEMIEYITKEVLNTKLLIKKEIK